MGCNSIDKLCSQLLESKVLHCTGCGELLHSPVMTVEKRGNVCQSCYEEHYQESSDLCVPNTALDSLLKDLELPCAHEFCSKQIRFSSYSAHVEYCRYRVIECEKEDCQWSGMRKAYMDHFIMEHKVSVVPGDVFQLSKETDTAWKTNVVQTSCGAFVLHTFVTQISYSFLICDIGHSPRDSHFEVAIKFDDGSNIYSVFCEIIDSNVIFPSFRDKLSTKVKQEALAAIFPEEPDVRFELNVDNAIHVDHDMLSELKCSVCSELLKVPIYKCPSGRASICSRCFLCSKNCGNCVNCASTYVKDKALNTLLSRVRRPCMFKDKGCHIKYLSYIDHESKCSFCNWNCFVCNTEIVDYPNLVDHLETEHGKGFYKTNAIRVSAKNNNCNPEKKMWWVRAYHRLFLISHQCSGFGNTKHDCKWNVEHIGPKDSRFIFEVEISTEKYEGKAIILRNECQYKSQFSKQVWARDIWYEINNSVFDSFRADNGQYGYSVTIKPYTP